MRKVPDFGCTYMDTPERRVLDMSSELPFLPVLGRSRTARIRDAAVEHRHSGYMEMTLCERGSVEFDCEGRVWKLLPGSMFVTQPKDAHHLRVNPKGSNLWWVFFRVPRRGETIAFLDPIETQWLTGLLKSMPSRLFQATDAARDRFRELLSIVDRKSVGSQSRTVRLRMSAISLLLAVADAGHADVPIPRDDALREVIEQMRNRPEIDYQLGDLLARTRLSQSSLAQKFKQIVGLPPHAFLLACRIQRAKELLVQTDRLVTDIAAELKFSSSQHFATCFKQETGVSPRDWRNGKGCETVAAKIKEQGKA